MSELRSAIDGLAAIDVAGVPAVGLGGHIRELMTQRDRLDGQIQRALTVFDQQGFCEADGAGSTAGWLRGRCRLAATEASARVKTARFLRGLPVTRAALEAGDISLAHARSIAMLAADTDVDATRGVEAALVEVARIVDPVRLANELRLIRDAFDRDRSNNDGSNSDDKATSEFDRRRFSVAASFDGMFSLGGWLPAEGGSMLKTALDALAKPLPDDLRTRAQRYADALVELARRQLDRGDLPADHGVRPHLFAITEVHPEPSEPSDQPGQAGHDRPDPSDQGDR